MPGMGNPTAGPVGKSRVSSVLATAAQFFVLTGATMNSTGAAAVPDCTVTLFETNTELEAGYTTSDSTGQFTFNAPIHNALTYYLVAYKAGAPDLAGTTRNVLTGTPSVTVYMRDPTIPDSAGSSAYRPIGSPVVRRLQ